jgi:uncharacterized protein (DUF2235 family)
LLPKDNVEQVPFAHQLYKSRSPKKNRLAEEFKNAFCRELKIDFLGVWFVTNPIVGRFSPSLIVRHRDTVASVGYLYSPRTLPFVGTNHMIKVFRHALALDEVRTVNRTAIYPATSPLYCAG